MGYIRKHKEQLWSGIELVLVGFLTLGMAPTLIWMTGLG